MRALISTLAVLAALSAAASAQAAAAVPAPVLRALAASAAVPGARIETTGYRGPARCDALRAELDRPTTASGSIPVRIEGRGPEGRPCSGVALAEARVYAPVWIASRAIAAGEAIDGAVSKLEREVRQGHAPLAEIPAGAAASRMLPAGTLIEAALVQDPGWLPGAPVRVVVHAGGLSLVQQGRIVPCPPGRACAVLPSGRRVEGRRSGGELVLEAP